MATDTPARRTLRFSEVKEVIADVEKLADAERAGRLRCLGNWTFGQSLNHLATWVDYAYDGIPMKIPFFVRWIAKPMKKRMLTQPMKPGQRIPRIKDGTLATEAVSTEAGLAHFQKSFDRLANETPSRPSPLFGPMTHQEWIALQLRHAELHLSMMTDGSGGA